MKKYRWAIIFLIAITTCALFLNFNIMGSTSGTVRLFIDGEETEIDGVVIELTFIRGDGNESSVSRQLRNGRFHFNRSQYGMYAINFSLAPDIWDDLGQAIHFEIHYFSIDARAITEFDIKLNVVTEANMIEVIANAGRAHTHISSDKMSIDPAGMIISIHIPSP